ncbi:hypothetical protein APHAL10511_004932 [Amanita phalloides]|nr:hypothetical protein APHAL10511_004932 [Amanita phalloides]
MASTRQISGSVPGILDPTQPERLLRLPGSTLHFAAFDPLAATARQDIADIRRLSVKDNSCRQRRIVIETAPSGDSFWRYVPNARLDDGVGDEGTWPRAINICGEVIQCSQDQWDIYKLDPLYVCSVRTQHLTQITRITNAKTIPQNFHRKRRATLSPERTTPVPSRKKLCKRPDRDLSAVDADLTVIDDMSIDPPPQPNSTEHVLRDIKHGGRFRREDISRTMEDFPKGVKKRKQPDIPESLLIPDVSEQINSREQDHTTCVYPPNGKRARTVSPSTLRRKPDSKRENTKRKRIEQELARREERDKKLFDTLIAEAANLIQGDAPGHDFDDAVPEPAQSAESTEQARQTAIEESRKKIAELEADKPLWEAAAKQRMMREKQEVETIRVVTGSSRMTEKTEAKRKARINREAEDTRKEEDGEAIRKERERRRRQQQRWAFGPWTNQRALERYKVLSEEFDSTKFSTELPLNVESVPWPVLVPPARFNIAHVDWGAVEKFFAGVRDYMAPQEFKTFVEKSHRRFHPDRWRSRSLLKTVLDGAERNDMEVAANTVTQALTPLWREVTGR